MVAVRVVLLLLGMYVCSSVFLLLPRVGLCHLVVAFPSHNCFSGYGMRKKSHINDIIRI